MSYIPLHPNTNSQTECPGQPQQSPSIPPSSVNSTLYTNQPVAQMDQVPQFFPGFYYGYVQDPMAELKVATEALIHQKPQFEEQFLGCQFPNRYYVFINSPKFIGKKMLFKCKEQSECCQRNCCPAGAREFLMAIKHVEPNKETDDNFTKANISAYKPFKCTCCCLERPEMNVIVNGNLVGTVEQPFYCCDPIFTIKDKFGKLKYFIWADCCQCGYCCGNNICGKLSETWFNIYYDQRKSEVVGKIVKKVAKLSEMITNADSYLITFPPYATPADKLLLITAALMIDYQYFENSPERAHESHTYRQAI